MPESISGHRYVAAYRRTPSWKSRIEASSHWRRQRLRRSSSHRHVVSRAPRARIRSVLRPTRRRLSIGKKQVSTTRVSRSSSSTRGSSPAVRRPRAKKRTSRPSSGSSCITHSGRSSMVMSSSISWLALHNGDADGRLAGTQENRVQTKKGDGRRIVPRLRPKSKVSRRVWCWFRMWMRPPKRWWTRDAGPEGNGSSGHQFHCQQLAFPL